MTVEQASSSERSRRVAEILDEYLEARDRAAAPTASELLARHPELAAELQACLESLQFLHRAGESEAEPTAGTVLGDFQILRLLGRGGMGAVYEARQLSLDRRVALKTLPAAAALDERMLRRFHTECAIAASLAHDHIVPVYCVGDSGGAHYYVMQRIVGQSLAEWIRSQWPADAEIPARRGAAFYQRVARWGAAAARAVHFAHEHGVLHRDLKPSNLLLDECDKLWVADFGLAQLQQGPGLTASQDVLGTLRYMSPEQARLRPEMVDARSDVYSLGCTFYEAATGRPVIAGEMRGDILRELSERTPPPPRRFTDCPRDLETILLKALEKEPAKRYSSAQDLADDLDRFCQWQPISARRQTWWERAGRLARRYRGLVATALVALVVLTAGSVVAAALLWRSGQRTTAALEKSVQNAALAQRHLYAAEMNLAVEAAKLDHAVRVLELLESHRPRQGQPDLRGFEWHYLWTRSHHGLLNRTRPDFRCTVLERLAGRNAWALGDATGGLHIWADNLSSESEVARSNAADAVTALGARDPWLLVGRSSGAVELWRADPLARHRTLLASGPAVRGVALAGGGPSLLALDEQGTLHRWEHPEASPRTDSAREGRWTAVALAPDAAQYVVGDTAGRWTAFDADGQARIGPIAAHVDEMGELDIDPTGTLLATSGDWEPRLWELSTGRLLQTFNGHRGRAPRVEFASDGKSLLSAGIDGTLKAWDFDRDAPRPERRSHASTVVALAAGHGDTALALDDRGVVSRWKIDAPPPRVLVGHSPRLHPMAFWHGLVFLDERTLLSGEDDGTLAIWDVEAGTHADMKLGDAPLTALNVAARRSIAGDSKGRLFVVDLSSRSFEASWQGHSAQVTSAAFAPDGATAVTAASDQSVRFWRLPGAAEWSPGASALAGTAVAFSHNGRYLATTGADTRVVRWPSLEPVASSSAHGSLVAFAPSDDALAVGGGWILHLLSPQTARPICQLKGHTGGTYGAVAFSPHAGGLLTASVDGTFRAWDGLTGRQRASFIGKGRHLHALAVSPSGRWAATWNCDGEIELWDGLGDAWPSGSLAAPSGIND